MSKTLSLGSWFHHLYYHPRYVVHDFSGEYIALLIVCVSISSHVVGRMHGTVVHVYVHVFSGTQLMLLYQESKESVIDEEDSIHCFKHLFILVDPSSLRV